MLIIQRITTRWTKASRGGERASLRNSTPHVLPLPGFTPQPNTYLFHDVECIERNEFVPDSKPRVEALLTRFPIEPLFFHVNDGQCDLRFIWSWTFCGAPERESHHLFRLDSGDWGQFICNGRFGPQTMSGAEWTYQQTVFNVAFDTGFDPDQFVDHEPAKSSSNLATLK